MASAMTPLEYQVLVVRQGHSYFAHLFDLNCDGFGVTADEAVTHVREQASVP
jgi:hypothetical protein